MQIFQGALAIINKVSSLPDVGFFSIKPNQSVDTKNDLLNATFFLPESHDDEDQLEKDGITDCWIESPTVIDIIDNTLDNHPNATEDDFLD